MPSKARSEVTRTRLLDAAIERMATGGSAVQFEAIAADVGLTQGALYHHFGSVDGLVEEVYKEAVRRHAALVVAASSGDGTGRDRLLGLVDESAALYGSGTPFYRLLLRLHIEAGVNRPHLAPIARKVQRRQREYMTQLIVEGQLDGSIRPDLDAERVGQMVNATLHGLLVQQLEPPGNRRRVACGFAWLLDEML